MRKSVCVEFVGFILSEEEGSGEVMGKGLLLSQLVTLSHQLTQDPTRSCGKKLRER